MDPSFPIDSNIPQNIIDILKDNTHSVSFDIFGEAVLGVTPSTVDEWASRIRDQRWLHDEVISHNLETFCTARWMNSLDPLAAVVNRIMELGRGNLPGVGDTYPIEDICVIRNHPYPVKSIIRGKQFGNSQTPDLITLRECHAKLHQSSSTASTRGTQWFHGLLYWEIDTCERPGPMLDLFKKVLRDQEAPHSKERKTSRKTPRRNDTKAAKAQEIRRRKAETFPYLHQSDAPVRALNHVFSSLDCTVGSRLFCINVVMEGDLLRLWYYDNCGCVYTGQAISLITDFERAAAILVAIANCSRERLGALPPAFQPPVSKPYPAHWPPETLEGHTLTLKHVAEDKTATLQLRTAINTSAGFVNKRTVVYTVEDNKDVTDARMVVKLSYQVARREEELVLLAHKAGVEHIPEVHLAGDLWRMSEGARALFYEYAGIAYEDHILRAVAYTRYRSIEDLLPKHPEYIPDMAYQILDCLHDLKEKADIHHRDVSANNVLYEFREGKPYFILSDYDLAIVWSRGDDESQMPVRKRRRGTLAFVATELIQDMSSFSSGRAIKPHYLRHDFESVFWLTLWSSSIFPQPADDTETDTKDANTAVFRECEYGCLRSVYHLKSALLTKWFQRITLLSTASFLEPWLYKWAAFWHHVDLVLNDRDFAVYDAELSSRKSGRPLPPFDYETVNGLVTRDAIKAALADDAPSYHEARALSHTARSSALEEENRSQPQAPHVEGSQPTQLPPGVNSRKRKAAPAPAEETEYRRNRPKRAAAGRGAAPEPERTVEKAAASTVGARTAVQKADTAKGKTTAPATGAASRKKSRVSGKDALVNRAAKRTTGKKVATQKATTGTARSQASARGTDVGGSKGAKKAATKSRHDAAKGPQPQNLDENDIRRRLRPRKQT